MRCSCEHLRELMDHCEQLADEVDRGAVDIAVLVGEVAALRLAFEAHRTAKHDARCAHVRERTPVRGELPTRELRAVLASLRDYLAVGSCSLYSIRRASRPPTGG